MATLTPTQIQLEEGKQQQAEGRARQAAGAETFATRNSPGATPPPPLTAPTAKVVEEGGRLTHKLSPKQQEIESLKAEIARDEEIVALKAEIAAEEQAVQITGDPRISTDPVPSGIAELDQAGQRISVGGGGFVGGGGSREIPSIESRDFDDPVRIRAARQRDGVDYASGLPFAQRASMAIAPNVPRQRKERALQSMAENFALIPDDIGEKIRYDGALDEYHILRPDENNEGQFRWTAVDGSGVEMGDIGDMLNLAEIGDFAFSVAGAAKAGKVLKFLKNSPNTAAAAGGAVGAGLGRVIGEAMSQVIHVAQGNTPPTREELEELGWNTAEITALGTVLGEAGGYLIRKGATAVQNVSAKAQGKTGVTGLSEEEVVKANKRIAETRADMRLVESINGKQEMSVTPGTASHSIPILQEEAAQLKAANSKTITAFRNAQSTNQRNTQEHIERTWGGNDEVLGRSEGVIIASNDAIESAGKFSTKVSVAQTDKGNVYIIPDLNPTGALKIDPTGGPKGTWQVRGADLDPKKRGLGIGADMYRVAALEAGSHGKILVSDAQVSEAALGTWKSLDGSEELGKLQWHPDLEQTIGPDGRTIFSPKEGGDLSWVGNKIEDKVTGRPLVQMAEPDPFIPRLLETTTRPAQGPGGRLVANKEFRRFLRTPGRSELGAVVEEMESNPVLRHEMKKAVFKDYEKQVKVKGEFSLDEFELWKAETAGVRDKIFTVDEMNAMLAPHGFRKVMDAADASMNGRLNGLSTTLGVDKTDQMFKDPSVRRIYSQMKSRSPAARRRTMAILDSMDGTQAADMRALFKEDLKLSLMTKTKASNTTGFDDWFTGNNQVIRDVLGEQAAAPYIAHLRTVQNIMKRRSDRQLVQGVGPEANPTALGLSRVIFGPLSRMQRFLSAGRKGQVRWGAASATDLITDPDKLNDLMRIQNLPISSRVASKWIQDNGFLNLFGMDGDSFDAEKPEDRQALARSVNIALQAEIQEGNDARDE